MSLRSMWRGHIKVSLLTVPVKVFSAINGAEKISFNNLHKACGGRINQKTVCAACIEQARAALDQLNPAQPDYGTEVRRIMDSLEPLRDLKAEDLIKGYEVEKGKYVTFTQAEIDAIKIESTATINITKFVPQDQIDPLLLDSPYYVAPEEKTGFARQAFGTLREAFGEGRIGLGKVQIRDREYIVALRVKEKGIVMHTMLRPAELRSIDLIDELNVDFNTNKEEVAMARTLVDQMTAPTVDIASEFHDDYTENLRKMIDAKVLGKTFSAPTVTAPSAPTSLMEALKASLKATPQTATIPAVPDLGKKRTAKADTKSPTRRRVPA